MSLWVRVDARLVHGQVVVSWIPHLGVRQVVVVDPVAATSPLAVVAMELAMPPGVKLRVCATPEPEALAGPRVLALVAGVEQAEALVAALRRAGGPIARLNLGNLPASPGRREITPSLHLSSAELAALERLDAAGLEVEARALPDERPLDLERIRRRLEGGG